MSLHLRRDLKPYEVKSGGLTLTLRDYDVVLVDDLQIQIWRWKGNLRIRLLAPEKKTIQHYPKSKLVFDEGHIPPDDFP